MTAANGLAELMEIDLLPIPDMIDPESTIELTTTTPAALLRTMAGRGPVVRLPTGLETLDKACRGGLPLPRFMVYGGAPGAGKTTVVTNLGHRFAKRGIPVLFVPVDEGADGIAQRLAQLEGCDVQRLEERDPDELALAVERLDGLPIVLLDGDDERATVEAAAERLARRAAGGPGVLVVDSIQTVRAEGGGGEESPRERVDRVVRALKGVTLRHRFLTLATCELNRGSYRNRDSALNVNDLAAFKETGGIEYAAQTALVLRSVPETSDLVDVSVPKNRAYQKLPFRLRIDPRTTAVTEVDAPPTTPTSKGTPPSVEDDARVVLRALVERPGIAGKAAMRAELRARGATIGNARVDAAVAYLESKGQLENRGTAHRPAWHARSERVPDED